MLKTKGGKRGEVHLYLKLRNWTERLEGSGQKGIGEWEFKKLTELVIFYLALYES